jgi:HTH-type transcriptional regulator / antitoxin HigA
MIRRSGKMTLTSNKVTYADLLVQYQPKVITSDQENEQTIATIEEISHTQNLTAEEHNLIELLTTLVVTTQA